jgi:hypothetical protein
MSFCPKCGNKIDEEMSFCPKCGAPLKGAKPSAAPESTYRGYEKAEKQEKHEKEEKGEKYEKRGRGFIGPFIGGIILIFLGLISYLQIMGWIGARETGALFLIAIGIIIVIVALFSATLATRRHPRT